MKPEFLVQRNGQTFVRYAGLLDLAHEKGIRSITTTIIQIPCSDNDDTAIVTATAEMTTGESFTGIGDAAPNNVSAAMRTCLIRMAETRAKARALRDALNAGALVALEELAPDGAEQPARSTERPNGGNVRPMAAARR